MRQPCEYALWSVHFADILCVRTAYLVRVHVLPDTHASCIRAGSVPIGHLQVRIQWTASSAYNQ